MVASAITLVALIATILYLHAKQNTPIIKAATFKFCIIILVGGILQTIGAALTVIPPGPDSVICNVELWLLIIPFFIIMGPLTTKTWRIYRIFIDNDKVKVVTITDRMLLLPTLIIILIPVFVIVISSIVEPPHYSSSLYNYQSYPTCVFSRSMIITLLAYAACITFFASVLAFRVRKLESKFNESASILVCLLFLSAYGVVFIPVLFVTKSPMAFMLQRSFGVLLEVWVVTGALFLPKMYFLKFFTTNIGIAVKGAGTQVSQGAKRLSKKIKTSMTGTAKSERHHLRKDMNTPADLPHPDDQLPLIGQDSEDKTVDV